MNAEGNTPIAWITFESKDGTQKLEWGCTASNPAYVRQHSEWIWLPLVVVDGEAA